MLENMKFKSTNGSGSLAAAYFVFGVGLFGAVFVAGLSFREHPELPLLILAGGGTLALLSIALRLRPELPSECLHVFIRGHRRPNSDYTPSLIKSPTTTFGTNRPPTVEEIRELKETSNNWVPSNSRNGRQSLRDD